MEASPSPSVWVIEDLGEQKLQAREIAAALSASGLTVQIVDLNVGAGRIITQAQLVQPGLVVVSILFANRVDESLQLVKDLRHAGLGGHVTIAGLLPAWVSADLLAACPALDSVVCGPPLSTLVRLAHVLNSGQPVIVPDLATRGQPIGGETHAEPQALDAGFPVPMRDAELPTFAGYGFATVRASRGCYYACTFCLPSLASRGDSAAYRLRPLDALADEIETLYHQGARLFLFDDEQFLPPPHQRMERVSALAQTLSRRNLHIAYTIKCRADDVDPQVLELLRDSGLLRIYVGVESGDDESLTILGKRVTARRNAEALAMLHRLDIIADLRALLFHPWSTLAGLGREIDFLDRVLRDVATLYDFHSVQVFPGTALAGRLRCEGRARGKPWPLAYTIADTRVEFLRRASPQVFGPASGYAALRDTITSTWYRILLARRFDPYERDAERGNRLSAIVAGANRRVLQIWREMLAFAHAGDVDDARIANTHLTGWVAEAGTLCAQSAGLLERLL